MKLYGTFHEFVLHFETLCVETKLLSSRRAFVCYTYLGVLQGWPHLKPSTGGLIKHPGLTVQEAKLLPTMRPFVWYVICRVVHGSSLCVFNLTVSLSCEGRIENQTSDPDSGARNTPGTTEKYQYVDYKYLSLICILWGFCNIFEKFSLSNSDSAYSIWPKSILRCLNLEKNYLRVNLFSDDLKLEN